VVTIELTRDSLEAALRANKATEVLLYHAVKPKSLLLVEARLAHKPSGLAFFAAFVELGQWLLCLAFYTGLGGGWS